MWLFDDILKKPVNTPMPPADPLAWAGTWQAGSGGTGDDGSTPVIIKTSESTVFGGESEAEAIQAALPPEPTVHAEEDYSSILVRPEASTTPSAPVTDTMIVTPTVSPVAPTVAVPAAPSIVTSASIVAESPLIAPILTGSTPTPTPAIDLGIAPVSAPVQDPIAVEIPQGPSLFDHIMSDTPMTALIETPPAPISPAPETSMFGGVETSAPPLETLPSMISTETTPLQEVTPVTPPVETSTAPVVTHESYSTPREFIEKSLASVALMLMNIENRHNAKKEEERGYREEKMRFAELEKNAYIEAEIMDRERDHALRMQSMFQSELETDTANREKKVSHTEARHEEKHTRKKHEEEAIPA